MENEEEICKPDPVFTRAVIESILASIALENASNVDKNLILSS